MQITLVADSIERFKKVMSMATDALGRTDKSHPENYEVVAIYRNEEIDLSESVQIHKQSFHESRRNPKRKRRSEESILSDITNNSQEGTS